MDEMFGEDDEGQKGIYDIRELLGHKDNQPNGG